MENAYFCEPLQGHGCESFRKRGNQWTVARSHEVLLKRTKVVLLEREESYTMGHNDTSFVANLIPLKRDEYYAVAIQLPGTLKIVEVCKKIFQQKRPRFSFQVI